MKKKLITLVTLWAIAWSPNGHAKIDSNTVETKKDLVEVVSKKQVSSENSGNIISFENARKFWEREKLMKKIMDNEKVKGLVSEYWEERIEKILDEILTNKDVAQFMKQLLNNENIQKALEEWDEGKILKIVGEELEKDGWNNSEDVPAFLWISLIYLAITSWYWSWRFWDYVFWWDDEKKKDDI